MTTSYNKLYNIWIKNENKVPATYGDVSLYSQAKADINQITTTNLAINKNNTTYALDVSGNVFLTGRTDISGNLYVNNVEITGGGGGGNTFNDGIVVKQGSATYAVDVSGNSFFLGNIDISNNGIISFNATNKNRKIVLYPRSTNEFQNCSIGAATSGDVMQFLVPTQSTGQYLFSYAPNSTSKSDWCVIDWWGLEIKGSGVTFYINGSAYDVNLVHLSGNENIAGIKTFTQNVNCTSANVGAAGQNLITRTYADGRYPQLTANNTISGNNSLTGANTFTNDGNTFNTTSVNVSITNFNFSSFTGFTTPVYPNLTTLLTGIQTTTLNGWQFTLGNANCQVVWSNGNNGLEYYSPTPPGYSYLIFMRAIAGSSFNVQQTLSFTAGKQYVMKFWSFYGYVNSYVGGSRGGVVTLSVGNSTDTYVYNDSDTRNSLTWRQHTFRFSVNTTGSSFIRWTASDTISSAGTSFPFALGGITIREYNSVKLTDSSQSLNSFVSGDFSLMRNIYTQNLYGTGDFGTTSGRATMIAPAPNLNCLCINNTSFGLGGTNKDNIAIGKASYLRANNANDNINIGSYQNTIADTAQISHAGSQNIQIGNNHEGSANPGNILIGNWIRALKPTIGYSVAIGNQIGAGGTDNTLTGAGAGSRSVSIGYGIFSGQVDAFSRWSPDYCVAIGHMAMRSSADYYNVAVGSMALQNMIGKAGASPGSLTTQFNTALGYQAGKIQTDLNRCTLIGANTDMSGNAFTDITCLGYNAKAGANFATAIGSGVYNATANSVRIGRSSDKVFIDGGLVATKGSSTYAIDVSGNMNIDNGKLVIQSSSNNNQIYNQTEFNNYTYYSYLAEFNGDIKVTGTSYTPRFYTELSSNNNIVITNDVSLNIQSNSRINMYDLYGKVGEWSDSKFEVSVPINANGGINIDGNAIENLYVDISNNQVIVGQKKFTSNRTYFNEFSFLTMDASKNIFMTRNNTISQAGEGNIIIGGTDITGSGNMTTSATNNTAFGSSTLTNLTSGRENQVYGYSSGASITTGIQNIVGGFFCGYYITTGQNNVAWGSNCFDKLTTGNYNSALGDNAGKEAKTSNKCSFIGWNSGQDSSGNTYSDSTALGAGATITGSNQVVLGTSSDTTIPKGKLLHNGVYQNYYDNTFISSNTTLNFPCNETHVVYETGAQFTITLPEITSASQLGAKLIFTLVTDNGAGILFIRQGTNNKLIPKGTTTAYTTSYELLNTGSFKTSTMLVAVRHTTTNTNYVWREI